MQLCAGHHDNACHDNDNESSIEDTTESMPLSLDKSDSSNEEEEERVYEAIVTSTEQSFSHQYSTNEEDDELSKASYKL